MDTTIFIRIRSSLAAMARNGVGGGASGGPRAGAGRHLASAPVLVLALAGAAFAQSAGAISGTVRDSSGASLPGATITMTNPASAVTQTAATNQGDFVSPPLPPGTYSVTAEAAGFKKVGKNNVIVPTGSRVNAGTGTSTPT
jgi:hypothetical protein